jgi:hypothetical protein
MVKLINMAVVRQISLDKILPGSVWQKIKSGKRYKVVNLAIDTVTNEPVVVYHKVEDECWLTMPVQKWSGHVKIEDGTYAPNLFPVTPEPEGKIEYSK